MATPCIRNPHNCVYKYGCNGVPVQHYFCNNCAGDLVSKNRVLHVHLLAPLQLQILQHLHLILEY